MRGIACPYRRLSAPIVRGGTTLYETIAPGCFDEAIRTGLTPDGKPIALVRGHHRNGRRRRDWRICDTRSGLRLIDSPQGLILECPHDPPLLFAGFSLGLVPYSWRRIGYQTFLLTSAGVGHVAVIEYPDEPCYSETSKLLNEDRANVEEIEIPQS